MEGRDGRVSFWVGENVLELVGGDGCTTLQLSKSHITVCSKMVK